MRAPSLMERLGSLGSRWGVSTFSEIARHKDPFMSHAWNSFASGVPRSLVPIHPLESPTASLDPRKNPSVQKMEVIKSLE